MNDPVTRRSPFARPTMSPAAKAVLLVAGLFYGVFGLWSFFAPESFATFVAFPFALHLLHDIGAFQIGIGATVLLALLWSDAVMVALGGYVVGTTVHVVSHVVDSQLGGHPTDAPALALLVALGLAAMIARAKGK
ncbi:MAG TPA: hypothetical protein VFU81_03965 [Thermomicrobiales bacterium]|nr:hypothetical protein [Thermomicrobiales bacterium]